MLGEIWRTTDFADQSINDYMVEKHHLLHILVVIKLVSENNI